MGRAVASMKLIESKRARENMYKKRGKSLKKKAMELSTLCNVDLCMIMAPVDGDSRPTETWPENPEKMHAVIESYKTVKAGNDPRMLKNTTVNDSIEGWIRTKKEELAKLKKEKYQTSGEPYRNMPEESRRELVNVLSVKIEALKQRIYDISTTKASPENFTNNSMNLLTSNNDSNAIQNPMNLLTSNDTNPVYYNTMCYDNNGAMSDHQFPETMMYSTGFQPGLYVMQPWYGCVDGGDGNFPALPPPAGWPWVDYDQYRSVGTCLAPDQFQDSFPQVCKMETPYLRLQ